MDIEAILEMQAQEIKLLRSDVNRLKQQETPVVGLENAFLAAQDGRVGAAEDTLAQMSPTALAWAIYHAAPLLFPNLVGVWYMSEISSGYLWDGSSQGRHLIRSGGLGFAQVSDILRVATLNGTDSYAYRASESATQITGSLSIMAWYRKDVAGIQHPILAKTQNLTGDSNFGYWLLHGSSDNMNFAVGSGSDRLMVTKPAPIGEWLYAAGNYIPSLSVNAWLGTRDGWEGIETNSNSIPASINPATATQLTIGALHGGIEVGQGNVGVVALMAATSNETLFRNYFEFTKGLFYGFN